MRITPSSINVSVHSETFIVRRFAEDEESVEIVHLRRIGSFGQYQESVQFRPGFRNLPITWGLWKSQN